MRLQSLLDATMALLANAAVDVKSTAPRKEDSADPFLARQRRIEHHKLSKDLASLRTEFQELQRAAKETMRRSGWYLGPSVDTSLLTTMTTTTMTTSSALEELMLGQSTLREPEQKLQLNMISDEELRMNEVIVAERDADIRQIEQGVQEINTIFSHLGHLVIVQQTTIDDIQANLEGTLTNVKKADEEIKKADAQQRKWGWFKGFF